MQRHRLMHVIPKLYDDSVIVISENPHHRINSCLEPEHFTTAPNSNYDIVAFTGQSCYHLHWTEVLTSLDQSPRICPECSDAQQHI